MKPNKIDASLPQPSLDQLIALWPAAKGSLALVYKPCIRAHCRICAQGDKHHNSLLSFTEAGRRRCLCISGIARDARTCAALGLLDKPDVRPASPQQYLFTGDRIDERSVAV